MYKSLAALVVTTLLAAPAVAKEHVKKVPCSTIEQASRAACIDEYLRKNDNSPTPYEAVSPNRKPDPEVEKAAYREEIYTAVTGTVIDDARAGEKYYVISAKTEYGVQFIVCKGGYSTLLESAVKPGITLTFDLPGAQSNWNQTYIILEEKNCVDYLHMVNDTHLAGRE